MIGDEDQVRVFDPDDPKTRGQKECVDFLGCFGNRRIMPSQLRILERNDHLLFIRHYGWNQEIARSHDRIFRLLTRFGNIVDAPGTVTVICLWGIAATKHTLGTDRKIQVYDHLGAHDMEVTSDGAIKAALASWWRDADGGLL